MKYNPWLGRELNFVNEGGVSEKYRIFAVQKILKKMRVLTIDDDEALCMAIEIAITENGDEAFSLYNLENIEGRIGEIKPDVILLDIEFEDGDGVNALPRISTAAPEAIIIFMSSHTDKYEVKRALGAGGVTYLKKPIDCIEIVAQINALKKTFVFQDQSFNIGLFVFEPKRLSLKHENKEDRLTIYQARLLKLLAVHMNKVVSRQEIYRCIWNDDNGNEQSLNNLISQLRKLLIADANVCIRTIEGVGYMLSVR